MAGTGRTRDKTERAALRHALSELDAQLAIDVERGPGARRRFERLVEQLRTPQPRSCGRSWSNDSPVTSTRTIPSPATSWPTS
ncbi:hypothetical protein [Streptomyces sp. NPDC059489]|uniref:hypothetical protein n=1 Tax=Streptomyces sp. NPDC059489 TaxID=3346849 RepID=UPI00369495AB